MKHIIRKRLFTAKEAKEDQSVRDQITQEFPAQKAKYEIFIQNIDSLKRLSGVTQSKEFATKREALVFLASNMARMSEVGWTFSLHKLPKTN